MLSNYNKGIELLQEKKFQEAYEEFSKAYNDSNNDYPSLYFRATTDFFYLKDNIDQTIKDFELLISLKGKNSTYHNECIEFLVILYDAKNEFDKIIKCGEEALKVIADGKGQKVFDLQQQICYILARAYYHQDNDEAYERGVELIDDCINETEDDLDVDYYLLKVELLIRLASFDEANNELQKIQAKYGSSALFYNVQTDYYYEKARTANENEVIDIASHALISLENWERYDDESSKYSINVKKARILTLMKKYDEALLVLDKIINSDNEADIIEEKIYVYDLIGDYQEPIKLCEEYLKRKDDAMISYSLAFMLFQNAREKEEYERCKKLFKKAYDDLKLPYLLFDLYKVNCELELYEENYLLLKQASKDFPNNGKIYYYLAITCNRINKPYDEQLEYYQNAHKFGFINELEMLDEITIIVEKPNKYYRIVKKHKKDPLEELDPWSIRRMGIRYLYGEDCFKINYNFAYKYLSEASKQLPDSSCLKTTMGRYYEKSKNNTEKIFTTYSEAYKEYTLDEDASCNCAAGYLAHAYLNGIGTKIDIDKAKELIIEAYKKRGIYSSNIVIYLYTYFALQNMEGFDKTEALKCLETTYPFYRYELTRYMYLVKIKKALHMDYSCDEQMIKKCLKYSSKEVKKYYKENKNKDICYPCFNNY